MNSLWWSAMRWANAFSMLDQRRRRWSSIENALAQRLLLAGLDNCKKNILDGSATTGELTHHKFFSRILFGQLHGRIVSYLWHYAVIRSLLGQLHGRIVSYLWRCRWHMKRKDVHMYFSTIRHAPALISRLGGDTLGYIFWKIAMYKLIHRSKSTL